MGYIEKGDFFYYEIDWKCARSLYFVLLVNGVKSNSNLVKLIRHEVPVDLRIEIDQNAVINIELMKLSPYKWAEVGRGTAK